MVTTLAPATEDELADTIATAKAPFRIQGQGTKPIGHEGVEPVLSTRKFSGVLAYEPEELILDAKAATPMADLEKLLAQRGQMFAFEPPDLSGLMGATSKGTLGGIMACGVSGPRRIKAGAARDHVLGVSGVTGQGLSFKAGARVVKNVTGYDMAKLLTGSYGTLAVMTSLIVKVLPAPETEETLVFKGLSDSEAVTLMSSAMQSVGEVSAAAHVPGEGTYLRLDGIAPSIAFRRDRLMAQLSHDAGVLEEGHSKALWQAIRDVKPFWGLKSHSVWRVSVAPSAGAAYVEALKPHLSFRHFYDWAGGLIWLAVDGENDGGTATIRAALPGGHATLIHAPRAIKDQVAVFQPQEPALAALTRRVKEAFDPRGILNPGRMVQGL